MLEIKNTRVYGLKESIRKSGFPMRVGDPERGNLTKADYKRGSKLGSAKEGSGHDSMLKGIIVQFDLKYPEYISPQMQRYHWFDIISSQSKMHRLTKMDIKDSVNEYVTKDTIDNLNVLIDKYNKETTYENFMYVLSNCPLGLEKWMGITTNYLQLKTIYHQRKNHKLKEWHYVCDWIENLPMFKELVLGGD